MNRILAVALLLGVMGFSGAPAVAAGDEEAIKNRLEELTAAWNKNDPPRRWQPFGRRMAS